MPIQRILDVLLRADARQFRSELATAEQAAGQFGDTVEREGASIGEAFTAAGRALLPLSVAVAGLGALAVGVSLNYDREFTRIQTLVGVSADEVDRMRVATLDLAGDTARAPAELASAMFTIQSAGLQGAAGTDALRVAAQQAALGMGDTRANAQNLTSALNAYRGAGLDAATAGDILTATVRAGNFEASQLAGSLGRVLPNAVASGVAFEDIGGAVALFTRTSGDANLALTQLDGLMRTFIRPSQQAQEVLASVGLSMQDVRDTIQRDGLVAAIQLMDQAFGGSREQLARVIDDSTGLTAAFQILDADATQIEQTFGVVANSSGLLSQAFQDLGQSDSFRFDQAINQLQVSLTQLGVAVLPVAASAMQAFIGPISAAGDAFADMSPVMQQIVVGFGALIAVAGPAALAIGALIQSIQAGALSAIAPAFIAAAPAIAAVTAVATIAGVAWLTHANNQREAAARADALTEVLLAQDPALVGTITRLQELNAAAAAVPDELGNLADAFGDTRSEAGLLLAELQADGLVDQFNALGVTVSDVVPALRTGTDAFEVMQTQFSNFTTLDDIRAGFEGLPGPVREVAEAILAQVEAGELSRGEAARLLDVLDEQADAYDEARGSIEAKAQAEIEAGVALGTLNESHVAAALFLADLEGRTDRYTAALEILGPTISNVGRAFGQTGADYAALTQSFAVGLGPLGATAAAVTNLRAPTEQIAVAAERYLERLTETVRGNRELATSYDEVAAATAPYRAFLDATLDPAIRFAAAQDASTIAAQRLSDEVARQGSVLAGALSGGFDTAGAAAAEARTSFSELGRTMQSNLLDFAAAGATAAQLSGEQRRLVGILTDVGVSMGLTREEARTYARQLVEIPSDVTTLLIADVGEARDRVDRLIARALEYGDLDPTAVAAMDDADARLTIGRLIIEAQGFDSRTFSADLDADATDAEREVAFALLLLGGFDRERATALLDGDPAELRAAVREAERQIGLIDGRVANVYFDLTTRLNGAPTRTDQRDIPIFAAGGVVDYFAGGGMSEHHVAQIAPAGAWRVWAEPETGGEAYIPLANDWRRERARNIWMETGRRIGTLGADGATNFAAGGLVAAMPGIAHPGGMAFPIGGILSAAFAGDRIDISATVNVAVEDLVGAGGFGTTVNVQPGAVRVTVEGVAGGGGALATQIRREVESAFCEVLGEARAGGATTVARRLQQ